MLSKRVETLRHRICISPENGICNYSTFTATFTHPKLRINHHSYRFLITCVKFWLFSVGSRAHVDQPNDVHVKAQALVPFVLCYSCTQTESMSELASLTEQRRQRLTQERETLLGS